jgi:SAM-dependent methyltransferase
VTTPPPEAGATVKTFLHVGCGAKRKDRTIQALASDEWREVTLDIDERAKPDILDSLPDLAKVPDGAFDAVFSSHNLEHLYPHQVVPALRNFRRVLKAGGIAIVTCPDLQCLGERLSAGDLETPLYTSSAGPIGPLDMLYGFRPSLAKGNLYMAHHTGFTLSSLVKAFRDAGFAAAGGLRRPDRHDLWGLATTSQVSEQDMRELCRRFLVPASTSH